mmetsp:Transcript_15615/g.37559  ORF Transcript_15615/g.37559 Transcript_15615/m.37559 type:complete len:233 (-) Transcript_15615:241-939(-)
MRYRALMLLASASADLRAACSASSHCCAEMCSCAKFPQMTEMVFRPSCLTLGSNSDTTSSSASIACAYNSAASSRLRRDISAGAPGRFPAVNRSFAAAFNLLASSMASCKRWRCTWISSSRRAASSAARRFSASSRCLRASSTRAFLAKYSGSDACRFSSPFITANVNHDFTVSRLHRPKTSLRLSKDETSFGPASLAAAANCCATSSLRGLSSSAFTNCSRYSKALPSSTP